jgi:hypothetical protein
VDPGTLTRSVIITNNGAGSMKVVLEPFWCEFEVAPADQIEFVGYGGDPHDVYLIEIVKDYLLVWEWDSGSNDVKINGEFVSDWPNPSPSLFGDWIRRSKERGELQSVVDMLSAAREQLPDDSRFYPYTSLCWFETKIAGLRAYDRSSDVEYVLENDVTYVVELRTVAPVPIKFLATDNTVAIDLATTGECVLWQAVEGDDGIELIRVW